jgi:phosphoserine phosphatase
MYILTLIANPDNPVLTSTLVAEVATAVGSTKSPQWLAPDIACDILIEEVQPFESKIVLAIAQQLLVTTAIDVAIQPCAHRRKRLLIADMDSTIIGQECIDELGAAFGLKSQIAEITTRAMNGEFPFEDSLIRRVNLLKGLPQAALEEVFNTRISLNPGAKELVATMRANGAYCALISGGFTYFTQRIAKMTGFDFNDANSLIFENGLLSGEVTLPILGRESKLVALKKIRSDRHLLKEDVIAVGDGANDLAMITEAGLGVAYHAKAKVAEIADVAIKHSDLTALLYLQGYKAAEIVTEFNPAK